MQSKVLAESAHLEVAISDDQLLIGELDGFEIHTGPLGSEALETLTTHTLPFELRALCALPGGAFLAVGSAKCIRVDADGLGEPTDTPTLIRRCGTDAGGALWGLDVRMTLWYRGPGSDDFEFRGRLDLDWTQIQGFSARAGVVAGKDGRFWSLDDRAARPSRRVGDAKAVDLDSTERYAVVTADSGSGTTRLVVLDLETLQTVAERECEGFAVAGATVDAAAKSLWVPITDGLLRWDLTDDDSRAVRLHVPGAVAVDRVRHHPEGLLLLTHGTVHFIPTESVGAPVQLPDRVEMPEGFGEGEGLVFRMLETQARKRIPEVAAEVHTVFATQHLPDLARLLATARAATLGIRMASRWPLPEAVRRKTLPVPETPAELQSARETLERLHTRHLDEDARARVEHHLGAGLLESIDAEVDAALDALRERLG